MCVCTYYLLEPLVGLTTIEHGKSTAFLKGEGTAKGGILRSHCRMLSWQLGQLAGSCPREKTRVPQCSKQSMSVMLRPGLPSSSETGYIHIILQRDVTNPEKEENLLRFRVTDQKSKNRFA